MFEDERGRNDSDGESKENQKNNSCKKRSVGCLRLTNSKKKRSR